MRNMDGSFNKKGPIKHMVKVNIYYQGCRERMEINIIRGQKWSIILEMPWLAYYNSKIDWRTEEVKMTSVAWTLTFFFFFYLFFLISFLLIFFFFFFLLMIKRHVTMVT